MLILGFGLGLKAKFLGLGLGILWLWLWAFGLGLGIGLECSGLGINNKANRHIIQIMQYWVIVNVHWIPTFELSSSCHKRPGLLTYLLTYLFYCSFYWAVFLENSENDLKLKDWINFSIYWKKLLSHSQPWPWPWVFGLGLACLWPWLTGLGLALTPLALLTSLRLIGNHRKSYAAYWIMPLHWITYKSLQLSETFLCPIPRKF